MSVALTLIARDVRRGYAGGGAGLVCGFFLLAVVLFPFAIGPDRVVLMRVGAGAIWVAALLAALLPVERLVAPDAESGWFDQIRVHGLPLPMVMALRIAALAALPMATSLMVAVVVVWGLEAAMNALHAPYRALVADTLPPEDQASGYAMQTVFIGLGALAGACAPILLALGGWSNVAQPGQTAPSIRVAFLAAALSVALAVGWTVARVREPVATLTPRHDPSVRPDRWTGFAALWRALRPVAAIQFLSWFGLYLLWVYTTPVVAAQLYGATSPFDAAYARGADFVGILFGIYNGVAGLFALLLPGLFRRFGVTRVHAAALVAGALGLAGVALASHSAGLVACAVLIGIAYASILSAPFVLAGRAVSSATAGMFIGVMNIFIVVPQLVAGLSMGWVIAHGLDGVAWPVLPLAGGLMAMGAVLSLCLSTMDEDATPA